MEELKQLLENKAEYNSLLNLPWSKPLKKWTSDDLFVGYEVIKYQEMEMFLEYTKTRRPPTVTQLWNIKDFKDTFSEALLVREGIRKVQSGYSIEKIIDSLEDFLYNTILKGQTNKPIETPMTTLPYR